MGGDEEICQELLAAPDPRASDPRAPDRALVHFRDGSGQTALDMAVIKDQMGIAEMLEAHGTKINSTDRTARCSAPMPLSQAKIVSRELRQMNEWLSQVQL